VANILITGANSGIGLELTRLFIQRGDHVTAVCRQQNAELVASGARIIDGIDFLDTDSIGRLQDQYNEKTVDILINNAGMLQSETIENMSYAQIQTQFEINTLAPLKVTMALLDKLQPGAKILMTTSRMGSISDNSSGAYYGYRASKAALNALAVSLANDLKSRGISVGLVHPGFVKTKMTGFRGDLSPLQSATGFLQIVDQLGSSNSGSFWHVNGEILPW